MPRLESNQRKFLSVSCQVSSSLKEFSGGMIRSVNLAVAVGTAPVEKEDRGPAARRARVLGRNVTLGANPRIGHLKQAVVD